MNRRVLASRLPHLLWAARLASARLLAMDLLPLLNNRHFKVSSGAGVLLADDGDLGIVELGEEKLVELIEVTTVTSGAAVLNVDCERRHCLVGSCGRGWGYWTG